MNTKVYKLKALTNLHAGSGDLSFGVVDKLVQRDPVSRFPVIHATSMKGSLKEFCENNGFVQSIIDTVFGKGEQSGTNKFFSAHLLTMPVRSNVKPFFRATCPAIIKQFKESLIAFNLPSEQTVLLDILLNLESKLNNKTTKIDFILFQDIISNMVIEDWTRGEFLNDFLLDKNLTLWFGEQKDFALLRDDVFMEICEDLPVVARNQLGENRNLWYEELVPRQSEFWFTHLFPQIDVIAAIIQTSTPFQVGANASVGYGYCQIVDPDTYEVANESTEESTGEIKTSSL